MATEGGRSKVGEVKIEERVIKAREKGGLILGECSLGERVHELGGRVRELEEWNDGTLSDSDENTKGVRGRGLLKQTQCGGTWPGS
jgi:hypothetical protein